MMNSFSESDEILKDNLKIKSKYNKFDDQLDSAIIDLSSQNIDEFNELHNLVLDETTDDGVSISPGVDDFFYNKPMVKEDASKYKPRLSSLKEDEWESENSKLAEVKPEVNFNNGFLNQNIAKLSALEQENQLLRKEISAFDAEFFEQLEDLKYRYSKLQEVSGSNDFSVQKENLPLDRLGWSARKSMTVIDKASYTSPLIAHRFNKNIEPVFQSSIKNNLEYSLTRSNRDSTHPESISWKPQSNMKHFSTSNFK
jgi:hypothetical protein